MPFRWTRAAWFDFALAGCLTAFMVAGTVGAANEGPQAPSDLPAAALVLVVLAGLALVGRRWRPIPTLAVVAGAAAVYLAAGFPFGPILFAVVFAAFTVGRYQSTRAALIAVGVGAAAVAVAIAVGQDLGPGWLSVTAGVLAVPAWVVGAGAVGLGVQAVRQNAAQSRAEASRRQTYEERLRTAREVHDIVGHGLAAISMQAGVALHVLDRSPQRTRELLESIRDSSQHSLDELRATLAVFRATGGGGDAELAPLAGLGGLPALVTRMADSGVPVAVATEGEPVPLLATVDHAAYRIVQESLTNVLRHAGPTSAVVRLGYAPEHLTVEVADQGRGVAADGQPGQGVAGMRARAEALGGRLWAGPAADGGFQVRAELPLNAGVRA